MRSFIPVFLVASLMFTLIIRRPNFMYAIYVYPAFLLLVLWVFERHGRLCLVACVLLLYLLPQYTLVFAQNRHWDMNEYLANVRRLTPEDEATVVGRPNDWFAFPDRIFFAVEYRGDLRSLLPKTFVLVEGDAFRGGVYPRLKSVIDDLYESSECGTFQSRGETVVIKRLVRKDKGSVKQSPAGDVLKAAPEE